MNESALLGLIADLYEQLSRAIRNGELLQQELERLRAEPET